MIRKLVQLQQLRRNLTLSAPELRALQERKLRAVVEHAYANVPYYRDRFDSTGIRPGDIRSLDDLRHLPITSKADLRAAGRDAVLARGQDPKALVAAQTSGSTGEPFTVYMSRAEFGLRKMAQRRALLVNGWRPRDRMTALGPYRSSSYTLHQRLGLYRLHRIPLHLPVDRQIAELRASAPTILLTYPSVLTAVLERAGGRLADLCRPRMLVTGAECFDAALAERCFDGLPALKHVNVYGSVETGRIAWQCQAQTGLHVSADTLILEIRPLEGAILDPEMALGETVITMLNSRSMPLIRYRLGDLARLLATPCSCGLHFPLMSAPVGRASDVIRLPSGRAVSPLALSTGIRTFPGIQRFQIVQRARDHLQIDLMAPGGLSEPDRLALARLLQTRLGEPVRLNLRLVDRFETSGIKTRDFLPEPSPVEAAPAAPPGNDNG